MRCRAQEQLQARLDKEHTRERDALLMNLERAHQQHRDAVQQAQQGAALYWVLAWWECLQHSKFLLCLAVIFQCPEASSFVLPLVVKGALPCAMPALQDQHQLLLWSVLCRHGLQSYRRSAAGSIADAAAVTAAL